MTQEPHPQRCDNNCTFFDETTKRYCTCHKIERQIDGEDIGLIAKLGCASHSTASEQKIGVAYEEEYGHTIPICQFCQKKFDEPTRLCPWLMYTKLGNSIVACAHFELRKQGEQQ